MRVTQMQGIITTMMTKVTAVIMIHGPPSAPSASSVLLTPEVHTHTRTVLTVSIRVNLGLHAASHGSFGIGTSLSSFRQSHEDIL